MLNLVGVWRKYRDSEPYRAAPLFNSPILNKSIIVKHRLRADEMEHALGDRRSVTKVMIPIDPTDLRVGASSFFVGERGFAAMLNDIGTGDPVRDHADSELLGVLNELPSLDPFLMRERLQARGFRPARLYFDISDADAATMLAFVNAELMPLIVKSFDDIDVSHASSSRFAQKFLDASEDDGLEPLRRGIGLAPEEFAEGLFCWKGFIYYKWCLASLLKQVRPVSGEIAAAKSIDPLTLDDRRYLAETRERLTVTIDAACATVRDTLNVYERAYVDLVRHSQPQTFRRFLLEAPNLFHTLGDRLGALSHIVSFWRFRFDGARTARLRSEELIDIMADFDAMTTFDRAS